MYNVGYIVGNGYSDEEMKYNYSELNIVSDHHPIYCLIISLLKVTANEKI